VTAAGCRSRRAATAGTAVGTADHARDVKTGMATQARISVLGAPEQRRSGEQSGFTPLNLHAESAADEPAASPWAVVYAAAV